MQIIRYIHNYSLLIINYSFLSWLCCISIQGFSQSKSYTNYVATLKKVTDVMIVDATSPVAAARYYTYICLAANEIANHKQEKYSLKKIIPSFSTINFDASFNTEIATGYAILYMGSELLPSGYQLKEELINWETNCLQQGIKKKILEAIKANTIQLCKQVLAFSTQDNFAKLSGFRKYTPLVGEGFWKPTAPAFMQAIEPHWAKVKPLVLDSARQFKPMQEAPYDTNTQSSFRKQLNEVYHIAINLSQKEREIASFWDCNPFALQQLGHVEFAIKKISPGGHWIGITGIACQKEKFDLQKTAWVHSLVAITLMDAFISCWAEKYSSHRIRPETAIKRLIDPKWKPFLQTPPFPEYTSGHSVISSASAEVLSIIFGDKYGFIDTTELEFDIPIRKFTSFREAAQEAAISRLYGGIHFRDAIEQGVLQGKKIGEFIVRKLGVIKN